MNMKRMSCIASISVVCALLLGQPAHATSMFAQLPDGTNSTHQSRHGVGGPVLADDFVPVVGGTIAQVEWWGSSATSNQWEITFHADANGEPGIGPVLGGLDQHFVTSAGIDLDNDGVFYFSSAWPSAPGPFGHVNDPLTLPAGQKFWLSIANFDPGWTWANGVVPPSVGSEEFTGVRSTGIGPNGGPHFGPWDPVFQPTGFKQDFAFRIAPVPEPASLSLLGLGLAALGFARYKKQLKG